MLVKNDFKILFQGDSITDDYRTAAIQDLRFFNGGEDLGVGYPKMVEAFMAAQYPELELHFFNRAISGNRTSDLLARWQEDCLAINPDILVLLVGINDVWRKFDCNDPTPTEQFAQNYESLLRQAVEKNPEMKIIIIEPSYLNEPSQFTTDFRNELIDKIEAVRLLAKKYNAYYVPLDGILCAISMQTSQRKWVFDDGVHLTNCGHGVLAKEVIKILESAD